MKTDIERICGLMRQCGEIMRNADRQNISIDAKCGRANFVTDYDKKVQNALQSGLSEIVPDAHFIGEEGSGRNIPKSASILSSIPSTAQ